ncbi:hypothetical protein GCM10023142_10460 [Anaerocolumna aminovalerica]|uniref:Uncharacterized protein n=2 Tax=Anaerocolumna aminovalerica TaxID=1527 RepID=A0A1I5HDU6_9FIRM|nr:hypothetical protein [Anaerocolumna aminovalerica]MBU5333750.1 hypothetical protein [Anaerocolumna aminovalerica]SFO46220.1 hypothetical protein SAMN04489757_12846 [Anaerocolumna aminovalerica]
MEQEKIRKFIASCRKEPCLTPVQFAENLVFINSFALIKPTLINESMGCCVVLVTLGNSLWILYYRNHDNI